MYKCGLVGKTMSEFGLFI